MARLHLRVVVLICVLVGGAVAPFAVPAAAQAGANNSSNSTDANTSSGSGTPAIPTGSNVSSLRPAQVNRSGNATNATNNSSGGGGNGGGRSLADKAAGAVEGAYNYATPDVPSTEEIANDTANWTEDHLLNATAGILDTANSFVVGTMHPVNSGPNGIFGTPTNQPFKSLYKSVYGPYSFQYAVLILLILLLALVTVMPYAGLASGGTYRATQACARIVAALVFIMFWWPIGTALAQFFDAIAMGIAPSGQELTNSMQGLFKLSLGPILASIAIYAVGLGEVLSLMFVYAFRQAAIIVFQFAMPLLLIFAYAGPHRRVRSMASTITWQYFALLTMTIPTAFLMRVGFEAEWSFGLGPLGNALISMMLLAIALATPFMFSIAAFRAPPSIQSLASGAAGAAVGAGSTARDRVTRDGEEDEEEDDDSGVDQQTVYVEEQSAQDRVAATDGGTNYTDATAQGPGPAAGALGDGSTSPTGTAERIRDFERRSNGQNGGSATEKTRHYNNQRDVIDVESTVINEGDSR
jgi:hypothetical protein